MPFFFYFASVIVAIAALIWLFSLSRASLTSLFVEELAFLVFVETRALRACAMISLGRSIRLAILVSFLSLTCLTLRGVDL